jgi:tetratricopeptide (TPR) repeat protein
MVLAAAQGALNQFPGQRATLEKVIALSPDFAPAPVALAASYLFNAPTDFTKAEKYYRRAIAIAPGVDTYYWSLGDVYRGSNRLQEARRYYQLALRLDPKDLTAPIKLGTSIPSSATLPKHGPTTIAASPRVAPPMPAFSRRSAPSPMSMPAIRPRPSGRWKNWSPTSTALAPRLTSG